MRKVYIKYIMLIIAMTLVFIFSGCSGNSEKTAMDEAFSLIEDQDYKGAIAIFETLEEDGETREILRGKGIAYIGMGSYTEAIEALERALYLSNGIIGNMDFDINYYLATAYYKSGNIDEAEKIYNTILKLRPDETDALYQRGVLYARSGRSEEAKLSFDRVRELESDNYNRLINIYAILDECGYKDIGQTYLRNALELGEKKMTDYEKGKVSFYLEDYESARTYLEKAWDESFEATLFLGRTYEILGDSNYAISVYSNFISSGQESPQVLNQMGLCKMSMGDYEGALSDIKSAQAIEDNGMMKTLKFNEIVAYENMGDFAMARSLIEGYIRDYPNDEEAKREYIFLKTR